MFIEIFSINFKNFEISVTKKIGLFLFFRDLKTSVLEINVVRLVYVINRVYQ